MDKQTKEEFLNQVFAECEATKNFEELSAIHFNLNLLILIACRRYRLPVPVQFFRDFRQAENIDK